MMWSFPIPIPVTPGRSVSSSPCAYLIFATRLRCSSAFQRYPLFTALENLHLKSFVRPIKSDVCQVLTLWWAFESQSTRLTRREQLSRCLLLYRSSAEGPKDSM